jgi:hypothetical protein
MKLFQALILLSLPLAAAACTFDDERFVEDDDGPGGAAWNHDDNVSCSDTAECGDGEICEDGVCQMARCIEEYSSLPPMGANHYFGTDGEFTVISDDTWIDAFEPTDSSYINSWDLSGSGKVLDVAGGNLLGTRPQTVAVAIEFSETLHIKTPTGTTTIDIGMWPKAIAAGDIDADNIDELVAFAEDGTIALCNLDDKTCSSAKIDGVTGKDVAVADIDGDGFQEAIFLLDNQGTSELIIWNPDAEETGQEETYGWSISFPVRAIAAGMISGGNTAEVVMLEDGGWWGWADDKLHVFSPAAENFVGQKGINGHTKDIAVGDRNSDDIEEIAVLTEGKQIELISMGSDAQLETLSLTAVNVGTNVQRISIADWDGDSASGRLVSGPELISGKAVPVAALMFPPYPAKVAVGALSANITLGDVETQDESHHDTVSLGVGMGLKFGAEAFGFKAKVGGYFNKDFSYTKRVTKQLTTGARYWILAQPELLGTSYAPVIMSCGCYHRYQYELDDPGNLIGGSGQTVDVYVPVGGQTQLWSSKRYNAMAELTGTLPQVVVPITVGDTKSYPNSYQTLDGFAIAEEDMLFPEVPTYTASDVGFVSYWLQSGETVSNEVAEKTTLGATGSFGGGIVEVNADVSIGITQGYSVAIGKSSLWAGGVPPIPDNPQTPEDEYELHRYNFQPFVYRQHYTDVYGEDAGFYVMHFAVNQ